MVGGPERTLLLLPGNSQCYFFTSSSLQTFQFCERADSPRLWPGSPNRSFHCLRCILLWSPWVHKARQEEEWEIKEHLRLCMTSLPRMQFNTGFLVSNSWFSVGRCSTDRQLDGEMSFSHSIRCLVFSKRSNSAMATVRTPYHKSSPRALKDLLYMNQGIYRT